MSVFDHVSVDEYNFLVYRRFMPVEDLPGEWERVDMFRSASHATKTYTTEQALDIAWKEEDEADDEHKGWQRAEWPARLETMPDGTVQPVVYDVPAMQLPQFHDEYGPIDPLEDALDEYTPKYRTLQEAWEAIWKRAREEREQND